MSLQGQKYNDWLNNSVYFSVGCSLVQTATLITANHLTKVLQGEPTEDSTRERRQGSVNVCSLIPDPGKAIQSNTSLMLGPDHNLITNTVVLSLCQVSTVLQSYICHYLHED